MYEQSLVKVIEPVKKTTISRLNKSKKWKYGYNKEHDIVVISKTGQIGEILEIQNLQIALPTRPVRVHVHKLNIDSERPLQGVVKYSDGTVEVNDLVGFRPNSEYEFIVDGERLYRVMNNFITIKYEYQGNEEEYNPSWAHSS